MSRTSKSNKKTAGVWIAIGAIFLIILLIIWLTFADLTGNTDVAAFLAPYIVNSPAAVRFCIILPHRPPHIPVRSRDRRHSRCFRRLSHNQLHRRRPGTAFPPVGSRSCVLRCRRAVDYCGSDGSFPKGRAHRLDCNLCVIICRGCFVVATEHLCVFVSPQGNDRQTKLLHYMLYNSNSKKKNSINKNIKYPL